MVEMVNLCQPNQIWNSPGGTPLGTSARVSAEGSRQGEKPYPPYGGSSPLAEVLKESGSAPACVSLLPDCRGSEHTPAAMAQAAASSHGRLCAQTVSQKEPFLKLFLLDTLQKQ